jgi:hypothetical protein
VICLAVSSKGKGLTLAGDLDATVQAVLASGTHIGNPPRPGFAFSVGGDTAGGVVEWIRRDLFIGDELLIKVVECPEPDTPARVLTDSEFSAAAAVVLSHLFPGGAADFDAMKNEAGISRLYGAIRYRADIDSGKDHGRRIGGYTVNFARQDGAN